MKIMIDDNIAEKVDELFKQWDKPIMYMRIHNKTKKINFYNSRL
jgi:hypothetical protein